jgi:CPA1 family monovalent cation:H+ antiporter
MESIVVTVALVAVSVLGAALARRLGFVAPLVLLVAGLALSFVPGLPEIRIEPELVLIGILPPLLYVAALQTSIPAFKNALRPILLLAVGLVVLTAFAVGIVVHLLLPAVPFAACVALGAVVAPPDAVSATAIARRIGLPRRVVTILEGESLLNDATALVIVRVSVGALGATLSFWQIGGQVVLKAGGGVLLGYLAARGAAWLHRKIEDPLLDDAVSLLTPFVVVIVAEGLQTSSVVAVVVCGLYLGHRIPYLLSPTSRLQMDAVWRLITFLLEGVVFLLVGLQLRELVTHIQSGVGTTIQLSLAVFLTLVIVRFVWVYPATYLARLIPRIRAREQRPRITVPTVIAWAGMRGVVTLAAALTLPPTGDVGRGGYDKDLFIFVAFATIVLTLLIQGTTLPVLARRLGVKEDTTTKDALAEASVQHAASRAALQALEEKADGAPPSVVDRLRALADTRSNGAWERLGSQQQETPSAAYGRLRREMITAERHVFKIARNEGRIPEEVLTRAQRELDLEESQLQRSDD